MATKIGRGEYVPDIYSAKLHYDPIRGFAPHICEVAYQMFTRLVFLNCYFYFFGVLSTRYRLGRYADFDDQYVKRRRFAQGCAFFEGPENNFYILTPSSPKTQIFGRFSTGLRKFRLKTGFNMGYFVSKHP